MPGIVSYEQLIGIAKSTLRVAKRECSLT